MGLKMLYLLGFTGMKPRHICTLTWCPSMSVESSIAAIFTVRKTHFRSCKVTFMPKLGKCMGLIGALKGAGPDTQAFKNTMPGYKKNEAEQFVDYDVEYDAPTIIDRLNPAAYGQKVFDDVAYQFQEKLRLVKLENYKLQDQVMGLDNARRTAEHYRESHTKLRELESLTKSFTPEIWESLRQKRDKRLQAEELEKERKRARRIAREMSMRSQGRQL